MSEKLFRRERAKKRGDKSEKELGVRRERERASGFASECHVRVPEVKQFKMNPVKREGERAVAVCVK